MYQVYVLSKYGKPAWFKPRRQRSDSVRLGDCFAFRLAKVVKREPFTIQLLYEATEFRQPVTLGIDAGYSQIGFSAVTQTEEIISGVVKLLEGIKDRLEERSMYRRNRRNRLRYRKNKGKDEYKPDGWLAPSIVHKLETHERLVNQIKSIVPISEVVVEVASFDVHRIRNPDVEGIGYQKGEMFGFDNIREYVIHRDGHKCCEVLNFARLQELFFSAKRDAEKKSETTNPMRPSHRHGQSA